MATNALAAFDKFNVFFQTSSTSTVHKLRGESVHLLKTVLDFFVKPLVVRKHSDDLTELNFQDPSTHLPDDELFIGDSTTALSVHLSDNEGEIMNEFLDKAAVKLEYRESVVDCDVDCTENDVKFWLNIIQHEVTHGCTQVQESCYNCPDITVNSCI